MNFARIRLRVSDAEAASEALFLAGSIGSWEEETATGSVLSAAFVAVGDARTAAKLLAGRGIPFDFDERVEAGDPFEAFRESLQPFAVGRFWIDARAEPSGGCPAGSIGLHVPAACAFGTGLHESTRGILRPLGLGAAARRRVLDVGCGSAILAIAAAKTGASGAIGFDTDAEAVFEACRNLLRNGVGDSVAVFAGGIECLRGTFDLVLANMIWEEVSPLLPSLVALLAEGGIAIFSGILDERAGEAVAGVERSGLRVEEVESEGEWRTIRAQKCPGVPAPLPGNTPRRSA